MCTYENKNDPRTFFLEGEKDGNVLEQKAEL